MSESIIGCWNRSFHKLDMKPQSAGSDSDELQDVTEISDSLITNLIAKLNCVDDEANILLDGCRTLSDIDRKLSKNFNRPSSESDRSDVRIPSGTTEDLEKFLMYKNNVSIQAILLQFPHLSPAQIKTALGNMKNYGPKKNKVEVPDRPLSPDEAKKLIEAFHATYDTVQQEIHKELNQDLAALSEDMATVTATLKAAENFMKEQEPFWDAKIASKAQITDPNRNRIPNHGVDVSNSGYTESEPSIIDENIINFGGLDSTSLTELSVGQICFAKNPSTELWSQASVLEVAAGKDTLIVDINGEKLEVSTKKVAFGWLPLTVIQRLPVGTRVIAQHSPCEGCSWGRKEKDWTEGTIGEVASSRNRSRYLVFFDDNCDAYIPKTEVRKIVYQREKMKENWRDVGSESSERVPFLRDFLDLLPRKRKIALFNLGETIGTYKDGQWCVVPCAAIIAENDCSLVKIRFPFADPIEEWIYRGSSRFQPINEETHILPSHRRCGPRIKFKPLKKRVAPIVIEEPSSIEVIRKEAAQLLAKRSNVIQEGRLEYDQISNDGPDTTEFIPHETCSSQCIKIVELLDKVVSPFKLPMRFGWKREISKPNKGGRQVYYVAPCGKRVRNLDEIAIFLSRTESSLHEDSFVFNPSFKGDRHYKSYKNPKIDDYSKGKEPYPIQVVNSVDSEYPPSINYLTGRDPKSTAVDIPKVCSGCTCTDDCRDSMRCECRELTRDGVETLPKELQPTDHFKSGYVHERISEKIDSGLFECNESCACNARKKDCRNRVTQRGITIPLQLFKTEKKGWGVRCLVDIPIGQFVALYTGAVLSDEMAEELGTSRDTYFASLDLVAIIEDYKKNEGSANLSRNSDQIFSWMKYYGEDKYTYVMDADKSGTISRFFNHSCNPNLFVQNVFVDSHDLRFPFLAFFASRHIRAGEELNWDYNYVLGSVPGKEIICHCGSSNCAGRIL